MMRMLPRKTKREGRKAGFSLTEATIGMAVVGIVCVALYSGLAHGLGLISMNREN